MPDVFLPVPAEDGAGVGDEVCCVIEDIGILISIPTLYSSSVSVRVRMLLH
jgi:hypothetical protein